jgi:diacylglycerol kinase
MCVPTFNIFCINTVMKLELAVVAVTYAFYMLFEQGAYEASWRVHLFAILVPILILKFVKDLDLKARLFITTILAWHVIDVLNNAIGEHGKNNELVYKNAHPESHAPGMDARVGSVTSEIPQECGKTEETQPGLGTQDVGRGAAQESL